MKFVVNKSRTTVHRYEDARQNVMHDEDIALRGTSMSMTDTNDLLCVRGVDLARQSVIREIPVPSGTIPNRTWGCGVNALISKGVTTTTIDRIKSVIKRRMLLNPRIKVVQFVDVSRSDNGVAVSVGLLTVNGAIQARVEL